MITNPKLVSNCCVKTVVCVRKPGPMDELAMRNAAPKPAPPTRKLKFLKSLDLNMMLFEG